MNVRTTLRMEVNASLSKETLEPCEMKMHLPLQEDETPLVSMIDDLNTVTLDLSKSL